MYSKCTNVCITWLANVSKEANRYAYVAGMQEGEKIGGASIVMWWA